MPAEGKSALNIELNEIEIRIGGFVAKERYRMARKNNVHNGQVSETMGELEPDIEGVLAELSFCKIANVYPQKVFEVFVRSKKQREDFGDVEIHSKVVDVKTTCYKGGKLICSVVNPHVDYYALMVGGRGSYRLAGLMGSDELCREERFGRHGLFQKPCYKADQHELMNWKDFKAYAETENDRRTHKVVHPYDTPERLGHGVRNVCEGD